MDTKNDSRRGDAKALPQPRRLERCGPARHAGHGRGPQEAPAGGRPAEAAGEQGAGDDLRARVDPDARFLRCRHAPARGRDADADRHGNAAFPRGNAGGHSPRHEPLRRCHHDPHPLARRSARACRRLERAGDQRAYTPRPPVPGDGGPSDLRGTPRGHHGRPCRLGGGQQQCSRLLGQRRRNCSAVT